jgi:F-type H+-transporting ATPase subunit b
MAADTHAGHAATTEAPGGVHVDTVFPPFDTTHFTSQLFWLVVLFGLLYLLMSRVALPRVGKILEDRSARIEGDLAAARAAQDKAAEAQRAHEKTVADAKLAAQATAQAAHNAVSAQTDAKRHSLEADLSQKLAAAETQIAASKTAAMSNVKTIAAEAAEAIVKQLTGRAADRTAIEAALASDKA